MAFLIEFLYKLVHGSSYGFQGGSTTHIIIVLRSGSHTITFTIVHDSTYLNDEPWVHPAKTIASLKLLNLELI